MANITCRDPELEESFSFCDCYDFNSPLQSIFFDESDDESYIEIALEPSRKNGHGDFDYRAGEEMELRVSFSSTVPFQEVLSTTKISNECESAATMSSSPSSLATTFTMSSSSPSMESDQWDAQMGSKASSTCRVEKAIKRKVQLPKVNRLLNMLKPSLTVSSVADDGNGRPANNNHLELVRSSTTKGSKSTAMSSNGIMMKFLIKFRALKIRTLLASLMKSCQLTNPFDKWNALKEQGTTTTTTTSRSSSSNVHSNNLFGNGERSRVLEMKMDTVRGVLEAIRTGNGIGRDNRKFQSCPCTTKSSPIHHGFSGDDSQNHKICAKDNSIQAAIAHCKRSFSPKTV
ncbi:suppressor protein [Salix suchowensis]|nr:suppressor protein [Salix suchowensis]